MIKNSLGFTGLYCTNLFLVSLALTGCCFVKESILLVSQDKREAMLAEREAAEIKCDKGIQD